MPHAAQVLCPCCSRDCNQLAPLYTVLLQVRPQLDAALSETGALLLTGLPLTSPEACEAFTEGLGYSLVSYEPFGGARKVIAFSV
jgi:hypothetical protein